MINSVLTRNNASAKMQVTVKSLVFLGVVILAVLLPQIVHLVLGAPGGVQWLPMYLPVLMGGCLLGSEWGLLVGVISPIFSFLLTYLMNNPMPAAARLPFMVLELAVFASVAGTFSKLIMKNKWFSFLAVISAEVIGRLVFLGAVAVFQNVSVLKFQLALAQVKAGLVGLSLQAIAVPIIIIVLRNLMLKDKEND